MFAQAAVQARSQKKKKTEPCRKRNLSRAGLLVFSLFRLFISRLPDSGAVSSALYSSALCIFHIDSPFMFYVRQLGGEQLCGRRILAEFRGGRGGREGGRRENSFRREKWSRMPNAHEAPVLPVEGGERRKKEEKKRGELQTKALPQLLHYHNTRKTTPRDAAEVVVIRKQIDRIYKFSAFGAP